ncbi:MAG: hypothetical protein IPM54_21620 [Polyangiaceae bacterium]|nr:hypothetical protein [Polyangiaceae bacterium]
MNKNDLLFSRLRVAACVLALSMSGCDDTPVTCESSKSGDAAAFLAVEGLTIQHSLSKKSGNPVDLTNLLVELVDPASFADPATEKPLASQKLDTSTLGGSPASWSFTSVDLLDTTNTLLASIKDGRTENPLWVTTYANVADAARLDELRASNGAIADVRTFALTRDAIDAVVAPVLGQSGGDVLARGVLIGIVVDPADACGDPQPAVSDCTVTTDRQDVTISYPDSRVEGLTDETANQGMFFAVPNAVGMASTANFTITAGSFDSREWATTSAWIVPGRVTIQLFVAK